MLRSISLALLFVIGISFVGNSYEVKRRKHYKCAEQMDKAIKKFNNGRYNESKNILTEVKFQCSGSESMDTVLYYLGMSLLHLKKPIEAKTEFERLATDFAVSSFSEEAKFRIGHCSYLESNPPPRDQSKTRDAIRELYDFMQMYPGSQFADSANKYIKKCTEKIALKEFKNAVFYEKIDKYASAIVYYKNFIREYPESQYINNAKINLASSLIKVNRPTEAVGILDSLNENLSDDLKHKVEILRKRIKSGDKSKGIKRISDIFNKSSKTDTTSKSDK